MTQEIHRHASPKTNSQRNSGAHEASEGTAAQPDTGKAEQRRKKKNATSCKHESRTRTGTALERHELLDRAHGVPRAPICAAELLRFLGHFPRYAPSNAAQRKADLSALRHLEHIKGPHFVAFQNHVGGSKRIEVRCHLCKRALGTSRHDADRHQHRLGAVGARYEARVDLVHSAVTAHREHGAVLVEICGRDYLGGMPVVGGGDDFALEAYVYTYVIRT